MFQFHSVPLLAHLRQPPYRDMASSALSTSSSSVTSSLPPTESQMYPSGPFRFLDLPLELREQVYSLYFRPADHLHKSETLENQGFYGGVYNFEFELYKTCKQVHREARKVWRREVRTVKIGTPWPSAGMYALPMLPARKMKSKRGVGYGMYQKQVHRMEDTVKSKPGRGVSRHLRLFLLSCSFVSSSQRFTTMNLPLTK